MPEVCGLLVCIDRVERTENGVRFAVGWLTLQYFIMKVPCSILSFENDILAVCL